MKFFLPYCGNADEAENNLKAIAEFNGVPFPEKHSERIFRISWDHNRARYEAEVGKPAHRYFGGETVVTILAAGGCYCICTPSRGVVRGDAILAGAGSSTSIEFFDE